MIPSHCHPPTRALKPASGDSKAIVNASIAAWHHHPDRTDVLGREWFVLRRKIVLIAGEYRFGIGTLHPGEELSCQFGLRCGLEHRGIENQWRGMKRLSV